MAIAAVPQSPTLQAASPVPAESTTVENVKPNAIPPSTFGVAAAEVVPKSFPKFAVMSLAQTTDPFAKAEPNARST